MKKIIVKDYEALEEKLRNADEKFQNTNFNNTIIMTENYQVGKTWDDYYMIRTDVQKLAKQLVVYFMETSKGFEFIEFHDKAFMDAFKGLLKNETEFLKFLSMISLTVEDFLRLCIYICPLCFTSNLIKFVQTNYLHLKVAKDKKKTTKKKAIRKKK